MNAGTIDVLLATWNGERFLREQLDSLLAQTWPAQTSLPQTWRPMRILVRDDGSTDSTAAILAEYARRYPERITLMPPSPRTGSAGKSFAELLRLSTAPYVAFADQDDIWHQDKLARGMERMHTLEQKHGAGTPLLVFSDLSVVDEALRERHASLWANDGITPANASRLPRLLVQNVATGCTMLLNRALADLACSMPAGAAMHDWWVALLSCCFGASAAMPEPLVLYRQHGENAVGAVAEARSKDARRWRFHADRLRQFELSLRQAEALLALHGDRLSLSGRATVEAMLALGTGRNRITRVVTAMRHGLLPHGLRRSFTFLWLLWDLRVARRQDRHS